jgi:hypothetical protein
MYIEDIERVRMFGYILVFIGTSGLIFDFIRKKYKIFTVKKDLSKT